MDFIGLDAMLPDILTHVRGCSNYTIMEKVRLTAIDFCRRTLFSQETICELDITEGEIFVPIPCPSTQVEKIYVLIVELATQGALREYNKRTLNQIGTTSRFNRLNPYAQQPTDFPLGWMNTKNKSGINLVPTPAKDQPGEVSVQVAYQPTRNSTKIDRLLFDDHRQALIEGTLYRLLKMSAEEWGDSRAAMIHDRDYEIEVSNTKVEVQRDFGLAATFIQPQPLA